MAGGVPGIALLQERLRLGFFWRFGWRFGELEAPGEFAGVQGADPDLIGFGGADLAEPGYAEFGFSVPAAFYFDHVARRREVSDVVEAGAVFADIHGER